MYISKGHPLLTKESWTWISLNQGKQQNQPHDILCVIREIESPSGDLKEIICNWQELLSDYEQEYEYIRIEEVSHHRGCGEFDHQWYIIGQRKESTEEMNLRLKALKEEADKKESELLAKEKAKNEKEYQEFLKLQEKYKNKVVKDE